MSFIERRDVCSETGPDGIGLRPALSSGLVSHGGRSATALPRPLPGTAGRLADMSPAAVFGLLAAARPSAEEHPQDRLLADAFRLLREQAV